MTVVPATHTVTSLSSGSTPPTDHLAAASDARHENGAAQEIVAGLGAFLVEKEIVDPVAVDRAQRAAVTTGERLDQALTKLGLVSEADLAAGLSKYLSIPLVTPADLPVEPVLPHVIDADFVRYNKVMPLALADNQIVVGVVDPFYDEPVRALAYLTNMSVTPHIFAAADYDKAFDILYGGLKTAMTRDHSGAEASELDVQRLRDMASEAPTIRLVNQIITSAVELHASDIHIEPTIDSVLVRHRVDGRLRTAHTFAASMRAAITSRIKIIAKLDIAERRLPQDGRIKMAVRGVDIDFRVSTIPTSFGESVVMRILDRSRVELDFSKLGFSDLQIDALQGLLNEPNGIILVTGPTGSGKTTTLYTALKALNTPETKVFTVEDPIEYQLAGINQVQVQPAIGLDFPHALRSILRQDPDIIMIGEIRDLETARIAIQASLTGHLVLSTLHTNSAAAAITRLTDMGVENYLLGSTVKGVLAQRLVRRLCRHCSMPHDCSVTWTTNLSQRARGIEKHGPPDIRQARGCTECDGSGFSGRSTIAELLLVSPDIQAGILSMKSDSEIDATARQSGMVSMYESGAGKVWRGETTIEEVLRATRMG